MPLYLKPFAGLIIVLFPLFSYAQHQCGHRHGFERSPVADSIDAVHYRIHITDIDFVNKQIQAVTQISLRPIVPLSVVPLELKQLQVSSAYINGVPAAGFSQAGDIMRIETNETFTPSDTLLVEVHYGGQPFHESWGGFHFSGNYAFNLGVGFVSVPHNLGKAWFPCVDDFKDRATYEVLVTLPAHMKGIAGGSLINTIDEGNGKLTWHWKLAQSIPTYLASVAAGEYELFADQYSGLENNIPITIYTRPADTAKVAGSFQNLHEVLGFFEDSFDPYPWERIGYTGTAIGAMEHVTNIAYPHQAINGNLGSEYLMAHEISHMWFGNKVTCATAQDMWLNEGWATFCHHFYRIHLYGYDNYLTNMKENHYVVLKDAHIQDNGYYALNNVPDEFTYGSTVYKKGASVVHSLMHYMGDSVFFDAVKNYLSSFAFSHASSYDLRDALSAASGTDLDGFFDTWVFTPGTPHYSIDSVRFYQSPEGYETNIHLKKKHKGAEHTGSGHKLEISILGPDWEIFTDTVRFDGASGASIKIVPFEPQMTMLDYYDKTLDATTDEHRIIRETGEFVFSKSYFKLFVDALSDSAFFRITHHWAAPDSMKTQINGLRLSPYRYWSVDGIFPEETALRGRFFYSNSITLDQSLIRSESDSVVLLYRQSPAHEWMPVDQYREGLWSVGYLFVNELKKGEYTLAAWDLQIVGTEDREADKTRQTISLIPNPASDSVIISWSFPNARELNVTHASGTNQLTRNIAGSAQTNINLAGWAQGTYVVSLTGFDGTILSQTKLVVK
jgi:hypothetical protein